MKTDLKYTTIWQTELNEKIEEIKRHVDADCDDWFNQGRHEGIAEGRRLERESMRCESCVHFTEHSLWSKCGVLKIDVKQDFGCIYHERRKE